MSSINTNVASVFSQAQLGASLRETQIAVERLASGLRINSSRDDAAGLGISERLTSQLGGLDSSARAVDDSLSVMQIADGALSNISDNLQRMRELSVQAQNGTLSSQDRENLDKEYQQLAQENQRILDTTSYNGQKIFGDSYLSFSTLTGGDNDKVTFNLQSVFSNNAQLISGSLATVFAGQTTEITPPVFNVVGTSVGSITNDPLPGVYTVNVATVSRGYIYSDNVGAGSPSMGSNGAAGVTSNSNPATATVVGTPPTGSYRITIDSLAKGQISQVNVGAGNPTFSSDDAVLLTGGNQPVSNLFTVQFDDGTSFSFSPDASSDGVGTRAAGVGTGQGAFTANDYVAAFNAASGGKVTATYNNATGALTYTGNTAGANQRFVVNNNSTSPGALYNAALLNTFQAANGNRTQTATDLAGNVNGINFNQNNNNTLTAGGITFTPLSATSGFTDVVRTATVSPSQNTFLITYGDGTPSQSFSVGSGTFNPLDFVTAFNAAQSKFTAAYNSGTGAITYTGNESGANETLTVTSTSTQATDGVSSAYAGNNAYNTSNATTTQTGQNYTGTVSKDGGPATAFNSGSNGINAAGLEFTVANTGSTTVTKVAGTSTTFGNVQNTQNSERAADALDAFVSTISDLRVKIGANMSRMEVIAQNIRENIESYAQARSRILDTDYALESLRLARLQFLQKANLSVLAQANAQPQTVFSLLNG